jgi:hypothetical protein
VLVSLIEDSARGRGSGRRVDADAANSSGHRIILLCGTG